MKPNTAQSTTAHTACNDGTHQAHLANGVVGHHENASDKHPPGKKMGPDGDGDGDGSGADTDSDGDGQR
jgi:hypothetical protein